MSPLQVETEQLIDISGDKIFFFQAEDGIRDLVRSRRLGDVYKKQAHQTGHSGEYGTLIIHAMTTGQPATIWGNCLLYTSDAADDLLCVHFGGRRIIKKKISIPSTISPRIASSQ